MVKIKQIYKVVCYTIVVGSLIFPTTLINTENNFCTIQKTIPQKIIEYSYTINLNPKTALNIAQCESNYDPTAKNPSSSASGVFQFIDSTWEHYCEGDVFNEDDNIKCALDIMKERGYKDWNASRHCWYGKI